MLESLQAPPKDPHARLFEREANKLQSEQRKFRAERDLAVGNEARLQGELELAERERARQARLAGDLQARP